MSLVQVGQGKDRTGQAWAVGSLGEAGSGSAGVGLASRAVREGMVRLVAWSGRARGGMSGGAAWCGWARSGPEGHSEGSGRWGVWTVTWVGLMRHMVRVGFGGAWFVG